MPSIDERTLRQAIKSRVFDSAYYIFGDEEYLKEDALQRLIGAIVDPATRSFNLDVRQGATLDGETLATLLATPAMMADHRVVVVRDVSGLKKDARMALESHLERPSPDVVLIITALGGEKAKKDRELETRCTAIDFQPMESDRVAQWITRHAVTRNNVRITPDAAALLHRAVGNDLTALAAELDKLVTYVAEGEIDEGAVNEIVGIRRGETLSDLLDYVGRRDVPRVLELLPHILEQPKNSGVSIVMALGTQTLALMWGESRLRSGSSMQQLERDFFDLLRSIPSSYTGRPWGEATKSWAACVRFWDASLLEIALEGLLTADIALKESRVSSEEQVLTTLMLTLCTAGAPLAAGRAA